MSMTWRFLRLAVAHYRLLDLAGGVFKDVDPQLGGGHQNDPTAWATPMPVVTLVLKNSSSMAMTSGENWRIERLQILLNLEAARWGMGTPAGVSMAPAAQELHLPPVCLQNAKADDGVAGVERRKMRTGFPPSQGAVDSSLFTPQGLGPAQGQESR